MTCFHLKQNVETVTICEEEILLIVPDQILDSFFPGRQEEIKSQLKENADVRLLKDCPYLLINKGNRVRTIADEIFEDAQITPSIVLETENIETVLALAGKGMGIILSQDVHVGNRAHDRSAKE